MLFLLLIFTICEGFRHQCPVPEDRKIAEYSGVCYFHSDYGCCFPEIFNKTTTSCCYRYSENGSEKCCGEYQYHFSVDTKDPFGILMVLLFIIAILFILLSKTKHAEKADEKNTV
jgi:hypothetical protein